VRRDGTHRVPNMVLVGCRISPHDYFRPAGSRVMNQFRRPWFIAGVLCAVALFSTLLALGLQVLFGKSLVFVLVGPSCSAAGVLLLRWWLKATKSGSEELR
jgi:hypothetical protein